MMRNQASAYLPLGLDPLHEQSVLNNTQINAVYLIVAAVPRVYHVCDVQRSITTLTELS